MWRKWEQKKSLPSDEQQQASPTSARGGGKSSAVQLLVRSVERNHKDHRVKRATPREQPQAEPPDRPDRRVRFADLLVASSGSPTDREALLPLRSPAGETAPSSSTRREQLKNLTVAQLKEQLKKKGMSVTGRKNELIDRMLNDASDNNSTESSRLRKKTNNELKCLLKARGLRVGGKKDDLIARLLGREKPKAKVEKWEKSKARKLLKKLAYDKRSNIHNQSAQEVHACANIMP